MKVMFKVIECEEAINQVYNICDEFDVAVFWEVCEERTLFAVIERVEGEKWKELERRIQEVFGDGYDVTILHYELEILVIHRKQ